MGRDMYTVHIISNQNQWAIVKAGSKKAFKKFRTIDEAFKRAKLLKECDTISIHDKNGMVKKIIQKGSSNGWK